MSKYQLKTLLFTCGIEAPYPRYGPILKSLKKHYQIREITSRRSSDFLRVFELWSRLFFELLRFKKYDLILAGCLSQPLMPWLKLFRRGQLIIDPLISVYDTLCLDRKNFKPDSLIGKITFWFDRKSFQWADKIIIDSPIHGDYLAKLFKISKNKFHVLYSGVDEANFCPKKIKRNSDKFIVFFSSSYLPLHGLDTIVRAAKLLLDKKDIVFQLVGRGPMRRAVETMARDLKLNNIEFIDWIPAEKIAGAIALADVCLGGHFSRNPKAARVISGKAAMFLAMKKPTIVGESPATRAVFKHGRDVYMCRMGDEKSLAQSIFKLFKDRVLRQKIAIGGYATFQRQFSSPIVEKNLVDIINN